MNKKVTVENLFESYQRLIHHLVQRRMFPDKDLQWVLEPLGLKIKAGSPGLWFFDEEKDEKQNL